MKLALIPPLDLISDSELTDYQLVLPALCRDSSYYGWYHTLSPGDNFIILDNGAAEADSVSDVELIDLAIQLNANELCIPDTLGDSRETVKQLNSFFSRYENVLSANEFATEGHTQLGFVAQGKTYNEAYLTVLEVMRSTWAPYISTVYLPRLLIKETQSARVRMNLADRIWDVFDTRLNIHLFGSAPEFPREAQYASLECPYIRGIDTSMPYSWAFKGKKPEQVRPAQVLGGGASIWDGYKPLINRPDNYFYTDAEEYDLDILEQNLKVMATWTGNTL